jgi:hypothetical protein
MVSKAGLAKPGVLLLLGSGARADGPLLGGCGSDRFRLFFLGLFRLTIAALFALGHCLSPLKSSLKEDAGAPRCYPWAGASASDDRAINPIWPWQRPEQGFGLSHIAQVECILGERQGRVAVERDCGGEPSKALRQGIRRCLGDRSLLDVGRGQATASLPDEVRRRSR